jgi:hypothetical protein
MAKVPNQVVVVANRNQVERGETVAFQQLEEILAGAEEDFELGFHG